MPVEELEKAEHQFIFPKMGDNSTDVLSSHLRPRLIHILQLTLLIQLTINRTRFHLIIQVGCNRPSLIKFKQFLIKINLFFNLFEMSKFVGI